MTGTEAAQKAIDAHSEHLKINDGGDPWVAVWHLLDSLADYAEDHEQNIKEIFEDMMEERRIQNANAAPNA